MSTEPTVTDLVEQLENVGCDREPFTPEHAMCICRLTNKAAREIERLTKELSEARGKTPSVIDEIIAQEKAEDAGWGAICAMRAGEWCTHPCHERAGCGCADIIARAMLSSSPHPGSET